MNQRLITILGSSALVLVVGLGVAWFATQGPKEDPKVPPDNGKDLVGKDHQPSKKDAGPKDNGPSREATWLERLASTNPSVRRAALGQIDQNKDDVSKAIPVLLGSLSEKDPATRVVLTDVLAALGKDDGAAGAEEAAKLRAALALALDREASPTGKMAAAVALGKIGLENKAAIDGLHRMLFGTDRDAQRVAALALRRVAARQPGDYAVPEGTDSRTFAARWARMTHFRTTSFDDAPVIPVLIEALKDADPALQLWAAEVFIDEAGGIQTSGEAVPQLLALFQGTQEEVARTAAKALGRLAFQDSTLSAKILAALGDAQPGPRQRAVVALSTAERMVDLQSRKVQVPRELQTPEAVVALTKALADTDPVIREGVIQTLGRIGTPAAKAVPELARIAGTADGNRAERLAAFAALGNIGQDAATAIPQLLRSLKDRDEGIKKAAADALARYGKDAIAGLRTAVSDSDLDVRLGAIQALAVIGAEAKEAVAELKPLLKSEEPLVRVNGAVALIQIDPAGKEPMPVLKAALVENDPNQRLLVLEAVKKVGPIAADLTPEIIKILQSDEKTLNWRAADAIGAIGPAAVSAAAALAAVIEKCPDTKRNAPTFLDSPEYLSQRAIEAIRQLGPDAKAAVPALEAVLAKCTDLEAADALSVLDATRGTGLNTLIGEAKSNFDNNRETALRAIGRLGDAARPVVPALVELVVRETSLTSPVKETLIRLGPVAVPELSKALDQKAGRFQVLHTLGRMGAVAKDAAPAMLKASQDEITAEGMLALAALGEPGLASLVEGSKDKMRAIPALRALATLKAQAAGATKGLVEILKDKGYAEKPELLRTLTAIGPAAKEAGPAIKELLNDPSEEIQAAAALALVTVEGDEKTTAPVLLKLAEEAKNKMARHDAIQGLGRCPASVEKSLPLLQKWTEDKTPEVRLAAIEAIGLLGKAGVKGLPELIKALSATEPEAQEAACQAIALLGAAGKDAVPALSERLKPNEKEKVQKAAVLALTQLGSEAKAAVPALRSLLAGLDESSLDSIELQTLIGRALWKIEGKSVQAEVLALLQRQVNTVAYPPALADAILLAGELGSEAKAFVPLLVPRVDAASQHVRRATVQTLGKIGPDARAALPWLQRAAAQTADPELQKQAKDAISAIQKG